MQLRSLVKLCASFQFLSYLRCPLSSLGLSVCLQANRSALKSLRKICTQYEVNCDEDLQRNTDKTLQAARITVVEYHLMQAIIEAENDPEGGQKKINAQIREFSKPQEEGKASETIMPGKDFQKCLWSHASHVMRGAPLSMI